MYAQTPEAEERLHQPTAPPTDGPRHMRVAGKHLEMMNVLGMSEDAPITPCQQGSSRAGHMG